MNNDEERLLTIAEAAARLNVSIGTMRWRRHLGLPPHPIKLGRNLRYPESELDELIDSLREVGEKHRQARRSTPARSTYHCA